MSTRWLTCLALFALGGCPTPPADEATRFDPPPLVAKPGYCPALIESCPEGSHPVTGARAAVECSDPEAIRADGWRITPRADNYRLPLILGKCLQDGDCLVYCRLSASCEAVQVTPNKLVCKSPICGAEGCELDLGERRRCDLAGSPANCVACPADCPTSCADGVLEPGESCEPCTPGTQICDGNLARECRKDGIGYATALDCDSLGNNAECRDGACKSPCGNGRCGMGETGGICPADCACSGGGGKCLGDDLFFCVGGTWTFQENCSVTPGQVCFGAGGGATCFIPDICGNGMCEPATAGETNATCPADCR